VEHDGKRFCKIHDPKKQQARAEANSKKYNAEFAVKDAQRNVMLAAEKVYQSRVGAGWELEQQRRAVEELVQAYGLLESARGEARTLKA
jgi:uncharacterized Zn finger protein (UPF0148 family)